MWLVAHPAPGHGPVVQARASAAEHVCMTSSAVAQPPVVVLPAPPLLVDVLDRGRAADPFLGLDPVGPTSRASRSAPRSSSTTWSCRRRASTWPRSGPRSMRVRSPKRDGGGARSSSCSVARAGLASPRCCSWTVLARRPSPAATRRSTACSSATAPTTWLCAHLDALSPTPAPGRITEWVGLIADHTRRTGPADRAPGRRHWIANTCND